MSSSASHPHPHLVWGFGQEGRSANATPVPCTLQTHCPATCPICSLGTREFAPVTEPRVPPPSCPVGFSADTFLRSLLIKFFSSSLICYLFPAVTSEDTKPFQWLRSEGSSFLVSKSREGHDLTPACPSSFTPCVLLPQLTSLLISHWSSPWNELTRSRGKGAY